VGIGVYNSTDDSEKLLGVKFNYKINAGGEINASLLQYANCDGFGDGWRARVGIAVYAGASVTWKVGKWDGTLIDVKGSAWCVAEFPKPTYIRGRIKGSFNLVEGLYKGSIDREFSIGNQCSGTEQTTNESSASNQENAIDELNYSLIKNIVTPGTDNVNRKTNFVVDLNYPFNKSFDIDEQQATGEIKVRTFRANYTVTLTQDSLVTIGQVTVQNGLAATKLNSSTSTSTSNTTNSTNASSQSNASLNAAPNKQLSNNLAQLNQAITNNVTLYPKGVDMYGAQRFALNSMTIGNNVLKPNTSYKFKIIGKLEENINGVWKEVKKKNSNTPIMETQQLYFKTNSDSVSSTTSTNNNSAPKTIKKL
jgi:hypothetical protein